ncbi:hypothetical protein Tsubulata_023631 [Turnera subulata]|uniref:F-box domain-containing protein n=1 Tax=Turnera subulata TaxID=218843 RepID=A0A9Q0FZX4_9ROSI|nr:hypothetical protein Tsubulata_023631 [Turnera subulata]
MAGEEHELLQDLIINILSRLPPKSLIKCTSVCKGWRSLILGDPYFAEKHISRYSSSHSHPMLLGKDYNKVMFIDIDQGLLASPHRTTQISMKIEPTERDLSMLKASYLIDSCNGLICFWELGTNTFRLWNPIIRVWAELPKPEGYESRPQKTYTDWLTTKRDCAFGFSPETNDYKIIRLTPRNVEYESALCEIYTLGTDSWRTIEDVPCRLYNTVTCNGSFHWLPSNWVATGLPECVWAFRIGSEQLEPISLPDFNVEEDHSFYLTMIDNCLALSIGHNDGLYVWMMKSYGDGNSWTKCWSVGIPHINFFGSWFLTTELAEDGELLMIYSTGFARLCRCDAGNQNVLESIDQTTDHGHSSQVVTYVPTLISPKYVMKQTLPI